MKNSYWVIRIAIAVVFCFAAIYLFSLPAIFDSYMLASQARGNIGSAIGGITSPIIGLFTAYLLISTLRKQSEATGDQVKANKTQKVKNESDLIFLLFNQFQGEINNFYCEYEIKKDNKVEKERYTGTEGLFNYAYYLRFVQPPIVNVSYENSYTCDQFLFIARSYKMLETRIKTADIDVEIRTMFSHKLKSYFQCMLEYPLSAVFFRYQIKIEAQEPKTVELKDFYSLHTSKSQSELVTMGSI